MRRRRTVIAVVGAVALAIAGGFGIARASSTPDCVTVKPTGEPPISGVDRMSNTEILLFPERMDFSRFGTPTNITMSPGKELGFPDTQGVKTGIMYLPVGEYTFSGPWREGACNPEFSVRG